MNPRLSAGETLDSRLANDGVRPEALKDSGAERRGPQGAPQVQRASLRQRVAAEPHATAE